MGSTVQLRTLVVAALAIFGIFGASTSVHAQNGDRSVLTGAYTEAQAAHGDSLFKSICLNCHTTSQFTGPEFRTLWAGKPVFNLFDQLRNTMPQDNPGGLTRPQYAAVIAYVLKLNAWPAGQHELPSEDEPLKLVTFPPKAPAQQRR